MKKFKEKLKKKLIQILAVLEYTKLFLNEEISNIEISIEHVGYGFIKEKQMLHDVVKNQSKEEVSIKYKN